MKNSYKLLGILQSHAPDGKAQELCAELYRSWSNEPEVVIERTMAGMIYDGLAYGNWPWSKVGA